MTETTRLGAADLLRGFRGRELSPLETTRACLEEIERRDGEVHAFILTDPERALEAARQSERRWQAAEARGLLEVPRPQRP